MLLNRNRQYSSEKNWYIFVIENEYPRFPKLQMFGISTLQQSDEPIVSDED